MYNVNNGYFLNDIFILADPTDMISKFFNNYLFKNRLVPRSTSYRIEDNKIVLVYNDIGFEFPTNQSSSLVDYYNARYTDLYSCCFNTQSLNVYLPTGKFSLPVSSSTQKVNPVTKRYEVYKIANPRISCTSITENECIFFQRWYCRALRDLVGPDNMQLYDSNCNCYIFDPRNQTFIKMGNKVNCYDARCNSATVPSDPSLTTDICQSSTCSNMLVLKDILAQKNINVDDVSLNLSCK